MQNLHTVLNQILDCLGYAETEKHKIQQDIENLIVEETLTNLISSLAQEQQESIKGIIKSEDDLITNREELKKLLNSYYKSEEVEKQLQLTTIEMTRDYIQHLIQNTDENKRKEIREILISLDK